MRASAVPLMAELARERRAHSNQCSMCCMIAVEDQKHMLIECGAYHNERIAMFQSLHILDDIDVDVDSMEDSEKDRLTVELLSNVQCDQHVRVFLETAFNRRSSWMGTHAHNT